VEKGPGHQVVEETTIRYRDREFAYTTACLVEGELLYCYFRYWFKLLQ
jgi:hypothetical protein